MDANYFQKLDLTNSKYLFGCLNDNFVGDLKINFY